MSLSYVYSIENDFLLVFFSIFGLDNQFSRIILLNFEEILKKNVQRNRTHHAIHHHI